MTFSKREMALLELIFPKTSEKQKIGDEYKYNYSMWRYIWNNPTFSIKLLKHAQFQKKAAHILRHLFKQSNTVKYYNASITGDMLLQYVWYLGYIDTTCI